MGCNMTGLVTTIVGVIVLTVLADMMLPEGQTSKYIKFVIGIIVVYVMISGISNLVDSSTMVLADISLDSVSIDDDYISYIVDANSLSYEATCVSALEASGYYDTDVTVVCVHSDYSINVESVEINISKCGISSQNDNIDIVVQDIVSTISYLLSIDSQQVSVCQ